MNSKWLNKQQGELSQSPERENRRVSFQFEIAKFRIQSDKRLRDHSLWISTGCRKISTIRLLAFSDNSESSVWLESLELTNSSLNSSPPSVKHSIRRSQRAGDQTAPLKCTTKLRQTEANARIESDRFIEQLNLSSQTEKRDSEAQLTSRKDGQGARLKARNGYLTRPSSERSKWILNSGNAKDKLREELKRGTKEN